MIKQYILHRILMDEIQEFKKSGIKPNTIVMAEDILYHMMQWEDFSKYYTSADESTDFKPRYCGLVLVIATAKYSEDVTITPGECFVCCAAFAGKLKDPYYV